MYENGELAALVAHSGLGFWESSGECLNVKYMESRRRCYVGRPISLMANLIKCNLIWNTSLWHVFYGCTWASTVFRGYRYVNFTFFFHVIWYQAISFDGCEEFDWFPMAAELIYFSRLNHINIIIDLTFITVIC